MLNLTNYIYYYIWVKKIRNKKVNNKDLATKKNV